MMDVEDDIEFEDYVAEPGEGVSEAGDADVPDHVKAQYPDRAFFEYREIFLRHLMRDVSNRTKRVGAETPTGLDIGCNAGRYTDMLAKHGFQATGVDFEQALVDEAAEAHPNHTFVQGDAQALPFADGTFDAVISLGIIQCLPDWRQAVSEGVRVVKPGGVVLFETNRAYPLAENLLRSAAYLVRRSLPIGEIVDVFKAHRRAGDEGEGSVGHRKFGYPDLVEHMQHLDVAELVVHDPRKRFGFHDFIWAVTAVKRETGIEDVAGGAEAAQITPCRHCRRHGVVSVRTSKG